MNQSVRILVALTLLVTACGTMTDQPTTSAQPATSATVAPTTTAPETTTSSTTTPPSPTTTAEPVDSLEPLESYRFVLTLGLTDNPGLGDVHPLFELAGEATITPRAMRISGELRDDPFDLVTDGTGWWDLEHPELNLTPEYVANYLGGNGLLLPDAIAILLIEDEAWIPAGSEVVHGVPTNRKHRLDVMKGRDWELGDLALLEVWRDEFGQIVKFTAWWATGDNTGWPVATYEITERNPELEIPTPG